jgi:hypothetical protein
MKLREIFDQLAYSELSQLNVGNVANGLINEENYNKVLGAVVLGLTALHSRFCLKEEEIVVQLTKLKYSYRIHSDFSTTKGGASPYILDSVSNPYRDTLLKIERVYTSSDVELGLNDDRDCYSCHTPNLSTLNINPFIVDGNVDLPSWLQTSIVRVVYRANHRIMPSGFNGYDADKVEVDLPYTYMEALLYYVGSRLHNPMGLVNDFNAGNSYAAKYERACAEIERNNIRVDQDNQNTRLVRNGWK